MEDFQLEFCKRTDDRYKEIRDRHYVPNSGCHGQQVHFLIHYKGSVVGIITGASSVYAVRSRDDFFGIPKDKDLKQKLYLPAIVNNTVFRLEVHEKNLATRILARWRGIVTKVWEDIYGVPVIGFETFVVENDTRKGTIYKADNWVMVGETAGSRKHHKGLMNKSQRFETEKKLVFCKYIGNNRIEPKKVYVSSWRNQTSEEKERAKSISRLKESLIGRMF